MTAAPALRFGLFLGQASRTRAQVLDDFAMAEDLGFDHAWLVDHLIDTDGTPEDGAWRAGPCLPRSRRRPSGSASACS